MLMSWCVVDKTNADITSLKFNGIEGQDSSKHSQIVRAFCTSDCALARGSLTSSMATQSSGLGSATCTNARTGNNNNYILITCKTSTLTQYVRSA